MQTIDPKYKLIGHRGVGGLRPENTYCSFQYAAELGIDWIEFDVQLTKDEQWVIMHDDTIDRTTNGHGKIGDFTWAQIEQLEAGLWYTPPYPDQPIPTLVKTLGLASQLGLSLNIEIKSPDKDPHKHARLMAEFIGKYLQESHVTVLISSFNLPCIVELGRILPDLAISYLVDFFSPETISITKANNFRSINCDVKTITENDLKIATQHNIPVMLYTINDKALAKFWLDKGIAAVFTDRADLLL